MSPVSPRIWPPTVLRGAKRPVSRTATSSSKNDLDRPGGVGAQGAVDLVVGMGAPAGDAEALAAAVVVPPPRPAAVDLARIRPQFGLVGPYVPPGIDRSLDVGRGGLGPAFRADEVRRDDGQNLADGAVLDQVAGPVVDRDRALLGADLGDAVVLPRGVDHRPAFRDRQAHGLLDVGVHAGLQGLDDDPCPGVGRGLDHDGVEFFLVDHLAEIFIDAPRSRRWNALWPIRRRAATWQSHTLTTRNVFRPLPALMASRERPPQPMMPTRTISLAGAAPSRPKARAGTRAGRAMARRARRCACFQHVTSRPLRFRHIAVLRNDGFVGWVVERVGNDNGGCLKRVGL